MWQGSQVSVEAKAMQSGQGNVTKMITTQKWRRVTKSGDGDDKVATSKVQTLDACVLCAAVVLEVVAGIIGQCGSKHDAKRPRDRDKDDHNPKVATGDEKWRR